MWLCINISSNYVLALCINNYHKLSGLQLTPSLLCFSSGGHTSETGPIGLKSRCQLGPVTSEGSKGESVSLCFQLLHSLAHHPSSLLRVNRAASWNLWLPLWPHYVTYKDPCVYSGLARIIQQNLPVSPSVDWQPQFPVAMEHISSFQELGLEVLRGAIFCLPHQPTNIKMFYSNCGKWGMP